MNLDPPSPATTATADPSGRPEPGLVLTTPGLDAEAGDAPLPTPFSNGLPGGRGEDRCRAGGRGARAHDRGHPQVTVLACPPARGVSATLPAVSLALLLLPGCQALLTEATSTLAGITGASVASGVGADPAVTTGIGLGIQALGRAALQYAQRRTHRAEQDRIAAAAGPLPVGGVGSWATDHTIPVEPNERGEVAVSRVISAGPLECKEIVFSVDAGSGEKLRRAFYIAAICRDGETWRWASAEPATERWGSLQ